MGKRKSRDGNSSKPARVDQEEQKSPEKNGEVKKSTKKTTKEKSKPKDKHSSSTAYVILIVLSLTVGFAAVVLVSEDAQMFLVKNSPIGADTFNFVAKHLSNKFDLNNNVDSSPNFKPTDDKLIKPSESKHIESDTNTDDNAGSNDQTKNPPIKHSDLKPDSATNPGKDANTESAINADSNSNSDSAKIKDTSVKDDSATKADANANIDSAKEKDTKEDPNTNTKSAKSKDQPKRDYEKHSITSKGDYKIRKKLDAADKLLEKGDISKALEKYDSILSDHANSPRALWGKAQVLDKMSEQQRSNKLLEEAIGVMDQALRLSRTPEKLLLEIADRLTDRQAFRGWSHKEASTWRYLIDKYPEQLVYQHKLGVSYLKMGSNDKARQVFKDILEQKSDDGFALVHLGFVIKINDLDYPEAISLMQRGIDSREPGTQDGRFFYHLGDAYLRTNNTEKANEVYKRGADLGLFLSAEQRSLYNADTKLTGRPWWTLEQTTYKRYLTMLENSWEMIRDEGMKQLDMETGAFIPEEENLRETGDWKQFTLYQRGKKVSENCRRVPRTCALLDQIPDAIGCTRGQIKYSVMHPGVHVWPHTGPTNCRIRAHLGLKIPPGPKIRVGNDIRTWREGKFIVFDDSFEHEVWHDGTELRLVLIVDFWHPELPPHERRSLSPI